MSKEKQIAIPTINVDEDEAITMDEAFGKISMLLAKVEDPKVLSEVDESEIRALASLSVVAERMDDDMLRQFIIAFLRLRVSKSRKGRGELLQVAQAVKEGQEGRISKIRSMFGGLMGR